MSEIVNVYESNMPFIVLQVIGCSLVQWVMFYIARKMKQNLAAILFIVSFIAMLGMGNLGSKFDDSSSMHWIEQSTNIISQGSFLFAVIILHKKGLKKQDAFND